MEQSSQTMSIHIFFFRSSAFLLGCCVAGKDWAAAILVLGAVWELLYENLMPMLAPSLGSTGVPGTDPNCTAKTRVLKSS